MPNEYLPIAVLMAFATGLAAILLLVSYVLAPRHPSSRKSVPYESGIRPLTSARQRFPVRFYLVAMLFIIVLSVMFSVGGTCQRCSLYYRFGKMHIRILLNGAIASVFIV